MTKLNLDDSDLTTLVNALYVARDRYALDAEDFDSIAGRLSNGEYIGGWPHGQAGVAEAIRLRGQFVRQKNEVSNLIAKVEDQPDEDQ